MKCPKCNQTLVMSERQGVEIDYCPECRGVWLDRGELDKIAERSTGRESSRAERRFDDDDYGPGEPSRESGPRKRRGGFLSELFDFGD
jgi:Zn-finger nucleic acid-binding protein